ncbi:MAG: TonB-dependent receptor [Xanthomonadales bacterium]|nr:TonB-dependent receptor [Xanthomonadales bacterium]
MRLRSAIGALLLIALLALPAAAGEAARLELTVFRESAPLAGAVVAVDGAEVGRVAEDGALVLSLPEGSRALRVSHGALVFERVLELRRGDNLALILTFREDGSVEVLAERAGGAAPLPAAEAPAAEPGRLAGRIVSVQDGRPVAGARIFVAGTPLDLSTDAEGRFEVALAPGRYTISVVAGGFAALTRENLEVRAGERSELALELVPAGLELPEFVVLEPYIEGSLAAFVEERRSSAAVMEVLSAAQISRAGDSDAAGALRRVTGLTLVDGKFVYVRGLGERYSSVLVNGHPIPSPDPSRRVVPLDFFPTDIVSGVLIQKSYSPEMPGEFGGGSIQLRTRSFPEGPLLRLALRLGGAQGTVGEEGLRYRGASRDWTGRDRSLRVLPASLAAVSSGGRPVTGTPQQLQALGRDLVAASSYGTFPDRLSPDAGVVGAIGNSFGFADGWRTGVLLAFRFQHGWENRDGELFRAYRISDLGAEPDDDLIIRTTDREVEGSAFLNAGMERERFGRLELTSMLLRQTQDRTQMREGQQDNQNLRRFKLEWEENALLSHQLRGEHDLGELWPWLGIELDWQVSKARASRFAPNTREYRLDDDAGIGRYRLSSRADSNGQSFAYLRDDSWIRSLDLARGFEPFAGIGLRLSAGLLAIDRERDADVRRYSFRLPRLPASQLEFFFRPIDQQLRPENIGPDGFVLRDDTRGTDAYRAEQRNDARYLNVDLKFGDVVRLVMGLREEDFVQQVDTFNIFNPNIRIRSLIERKDRLPAASLTWWFAGDQQLRASFGRTVSRPDFREVTQDSPFVDPILDIITIGNPALVDTRIRHYDLRWERYFSPTESLSVALFRKEFENPIEKVQRAGSGTLLSFENALSAVSQGVELDLYKQLGFIGRFGEGRRWFERLRLDRLPWSDLFLGLNYARIESDIRLDPERNQFQTNDQRPMQGQSPYVANLQFGFADAEGTTEATLLYNVFGRRIANVGVQGAEDVYEEPFRQLDFVFNRKLGAGFALKLRLRNLLDDEVRYNQRDAVTGVQLPVRRYRKGRELSIGLDWTP